MRKMTVNSSSESEEGASGHSQHDKAGEAGEETEGPVVGLHSQLKVVCGGRGSGGDGLEDTSGVGDGSGDCHVEATESSDVDSAVSTLASVIAVTLADTSLEDFLALIEIGSVGGSLRTLNL